MISCMILSFADNPIIISDSDESDNDHDEIQFGWYSWFTYFFLSKQHPGH